MNMYKPKSRRPIADAFRKTAKRSVDFCVRHDIHPDIVSYSSIAVSILAALCFWKSGTYPFLLLIAPVFCYMRLWFNMLDGMVALASGKASLHGEIINEYPDRISDILIFAGVAHSGLAFMALGYMGAILALLTAYTGMMGQAVGVQREFSGLMSKPWRMVLLHIGAWAVFFSGNNRILDYTLIIIILGCVQTIMIRLYRIMKSLKKKTNG